MCFGWLCWAWLGAGSTQAQPAWTAPTGFSSTMPVVATVDVDGTTSADASDLLAVFVGSEVRGVAQAQVFGGTAYFFLNVVADADGETLTFRTYDALAGAERAICENLTFRADLSRGTLAAPFGLGTSDGLSAGTCPLRWEAVPGYTNTMTIFARLDLPSRTADGAGDLVAAVVADEVRAVGEPFDVDGTQVYRLEVGGLATGETVEFWAYDGETATPYFTEASVSFVAGGTAGTPSAPLVVAVGGVLPVELSSFSAVVDGEVLLRWTTASETNNAGFGVEMRRAGCEGEGGGCGTWRDLGFVAGAGTTAEAQRYAFRAAPLAPGRYAFRLRQVDYDGAFAYSAEVEAEVAPGTLYVSQLYPNPVRTSGEVRIAMSRAQHVSARLYDLTGRLVAVLYEGALREGRPHAIHFDAAALASGAYLLRVEGETLLGSQLIHVAR